MNQSSAATVFVIDNDTVAADSIERLVLSMRLECARYTSGREFLSQCRENQLGCVVTEVRIPDIGGLEIQKHLSLEKIRLPIVFVTSSSDLRIAVRAMKAGAWDYLTKPFHEQELWESIQGAVASQSDRIGHEQQLFELQQKLKSLNEKEKTVLDLLAEGETNRMIAARLGLSIRTIELRRSRMMQKLQARTATELLRYALLANEQNLPYYGPHC